MERIKKSYYDDALVTNLASMLRMPKEQVIDKLWANKVLTTRVVKAETAGSFDQKIAEVRANHATAMEQSRQGHPVFKPNDPAREQMEQRAQQERKEAMERGRAPAVVPAPPKTQSGALPRRDMGNGSSKVLRTPTDSSSSEMELSLINKGISDINPYVGTQYDVTNVETLSRLMGIPEADVIKKLSKAAFRQGINDPDAAPEGGAMGGPEGGAMGAPEGGAMGGPEGGAMGGPEGGAMGGPVRYDEKGNPDPNGEYDENGQPIENDDESESDGEYGSGPASGIPDHDSTKPGMPLARSMRKSLSLLDVFYATPTGHSQKKN